MVSCDTIRSVGRMAPTIKFALCMALLLAMVGCDERVVSFDAGVAQDGGETADMATLGDLATSDMAGDLGCGNFGGARCDEECCKGNCSIVGSCWKDKVGKCVAKSDDDCHKSEYCRSMGICTLKDGECKAVKDSDCKKSLFCEATGGCSLKGNWCGLPASDAHCRSSSICKWFGKCTRLMDVGPTPGVAGCAVGSDVDCKMSQQCKLLGRCKAIDLGTRWPSCRVAATTEAQCRKTLACKLEGECVLHKGLCVVDKDKDCKATPNCKKYGACSVFRANPTKKGYWCSPESTGDCLQSTACKEEGRCTLAETGYCYINSTEDCKRSEDCK